MLINILWPSLGANKADQFGELHLFLASEQRTVGLSCTEPITAKQQSVFWLVSQSRRMSAIYVGSCWWQLLADPVVVLPVHGCVGDESYLLYPQSALSAEPVCMWSGSQQVVAVCGLALYQRRSSFNWCCIMLFLLLTDRHSLVLS